MTQENLSGEQSIRIIEDMIKTAKREETGAGYFLVLWGIVVFLYSMAMYIGLAMKDETISSFAWIVFPVGAILSYVKNRKNDKTEKTKSWYDDLYMFVWVGVGICFGIIIIFAPKLGMANIIPLTMLMYVFASFVTGGTTRFYPSIIGAILCLVCVIIAFNVTFAEQFLYNGLGVLFVHIMPGIIMDRRYKRLVNAS